MRHLLFAVLAACTTAAPAVLVGPDAGPTECAVGVVAACSCASGAGSMRCGPDGLFGPCSCPATEAGAPVVEAGTEAGCTPEPTTSYGAGLCQLAGPCSDCTGSGTLYRCAVTDGGRRQPGSFAGNPHLGCRQVALTTDTTDFCCPGECARWLKTGTKCQTSDAFVCPTAEKATQPDTGRACTYAGQEGAGYVVCCN